MRPSYLIVDWLGWRWKAGHWPWHKPELFGHLRYPRVWFVVKGRTIWWGKQR
jgi:hypothetical protein